MQWKQKLFSETKNKMMNTSLLLTTSNKTKELFQFLQHYGYLLSEDTSINEAEIKLLYANNIVNKKVDIRLYNYADVGRFFLNIFVIRIPYLTVNDLIDLSTYFDKNNIKSPEPLEGGQRNIEHANRYIEAYADLFKQYGIKLITTDEQFPHYFPEWT